MNAKDLHPAFAAKDVAAQGEAIYQAKYKADFEKALGDKYAAVNVRNEDVSVADTAEDAIHQAAQKDPHGLFHLIRVGHPAAFDAGWYMSCAS